MTSKSAEGFYSQSNQFASSSSLSFVNKSVNGTGFKSTQQPPFTTTLSLPGALGIGSSSFLPKLTPSATTAVKEQSQITSQDSSTFNSSSNSGGSADGKMPSVSTNSLRTDGKGIQLMMESLDIADSSLQRLAYVNGSGNKLSNSSGRNFLVPIGETGARQKLSILSSSQRPVTGQKMAMTPEASFQRPRSSSESGRWQEDDAYMRRRPQTGEKSQRSASSSFALPSTSAGFIEGSRRPSIGTAESSRTFTNESVLHGNGASNASVQRQQDSRTTTPTQERLQPPFYHNIPSDGMNNARKQYPPSASRTNALFAKEGQSPNGLGIRDEKGIKRHISAEQPLEQYASQSDYNVWESQLPNESPKSKQISRPPSSSGRERAAKLGAGFKSIFTSRSTKEQTLKQNGQNSATNSASPSSSAFSQGSPQTSSHSSTPIKQIRRPSTTSSSVLHQSPQNSTAYNTFPIKHTFVDLGTAQSAGWTTSTETRSPLSALSTSSPTSRLQSRIFTNSGARLKSPEIPPSLDYALPASSPFMKGFSIDTTSSLSQESIAAPRGLGTTDTRKGLATTGLNLEVAGHSIPLLQHLMDRETESSRSIDKSLPPTPEINSLSIANLEAEGRPAQHRNHSEASTLSTVTILGPSAVIQSPASLLQTKTVRGASFSSSLSDSSRRASNATTHSEQNASDNFNTSRRPSSSAQSTSGESTYSAPNSSRAWDPTAFDKPSVPITSPLLASVLSQQTQIAEKKFSQLRRDFPPSNGGNIAPVENGLPDESSSAPTTPTSNRSRSGTGTKPNLPTRSKERPVQGGPGGFAAGTQVVNGFSPDGSSSPDTTRTPTTKDHTTPREGVNRSTYVPPGALTYTRKGTAVRPTVTKSGLPSAVDWTAVDKTPRAAPRSLGEPKSSQTELSSSAGNGSDGHAITFTSTDFDSYEDEVSIDTANLLPSSAWVEVEAALNRFKNMSVQNTASDKGNLLRSIILPFLALEAETPSVETSGSGPLQSSKARRGLFFEWIQYLLMELQTIQTSADRGAILESIACIIESKTFSASMFQSDKEDEKKFYSVFGHILNYAIEELNKKGVYQNTLIFSGRLLAVAFFRIENVASKLLRALPVNRFALERVASEAKWDINDPDLGNWESYKQRFPPSLSDFCFQDARSYLKMLDSQTHITSDASVSEEQADDDRYLIRQAEVEVEMSGNWLRRWQSDDSELFFSFCRNYHRQLAGFLTSGRGWNSIRTPFFGGPGYAHLATCIHQKCLSLVHRDILSVTTLSSQKNFNPGETANVLSGSTAGKPRHLEAANRRCTAIVVDIVRAPLSHPLVFGPMLGIHIKSLIKRTSLYDVQGVFCLLDWLDGVLGHMESVELPVERFVDIEFVIETVWLLLKDADHALALMRTIAFCYSNFAVLASTTKNRIRFCEEILLNPKIFQKLFLSWSFTIRAYFLHLLVFRLARINDFAHPEDDVKGKTSVSVARIFNQRLDEIRKRHDELSPSPSSADSGSEEDGDLDRFKTRPQSFVSTIKHTPISNKQVSPGAISKAERILGIGLPDPALSTKGDNKSQSKAAKWLRALGAKSPGKSGKKGEGVGMNSSLSNSFSMESRLFGTYETPKRMARVDELDLFSDDDDDFDEDDNSPASEDGGDSTPKAEGQFEFSFDAQNGHEEQNSENGRAGELASEDQDKIALNDHISPKLSFDLQNPTSTLPPLTEGPTDGLTNGKLPLSLGHDRISRAFSKRQSILPEPAFNLVNYEYESEEDDPTKAGDKDASSSFITYQNNLKKKQEMQKADPYAENLHIYAVQSLREYEQTVQEHDEFFAKQADTGNPQVPRLPIQWPAMWSE